MTTDTDTYTLPITIGNVLRVEIRIPETFSSEARTVEHTVQVTGLRTSACNGYLIPVFEAMKLDGAWEQTQAAN